MAAQTGETLRATHDPTDFTGAVILRNPGSTKNGTPAGEHVLSTIQINWPGSNIYNILPRDPERPEHDPSEQLVRDMVAEASDKTDDPNILVIVLGGDGTAATAARAIAGINAGRSAEDRRHAMAVVPCGNGNVFAAMVNGKGQRSPRMPSQLVHPHRGIVRDVPLLEMAVSSPAGSERQRSTSVRHGIIGVGLGLTATYAEVINSADYRSMPGYSIPLVRAVHELASARGLLRDIRDGKRVAGIQADRLPSGEPMRFVSLDFVNGRLYAKVISRQESEQSLFDPQATMYVLHDEAYMADWAYAVQTGEWPTEQIKPRSSCNIKLKDATPAHVDGEHFTIPAGSSVSIRVAPDMAARVLAHRVTSSRNKPSSTNTPTLAHMAIAEFTRYVVRQVSPEFCAPGPRTNR